jgi:hypothetical protein
MRHLRPVFVTLCLSALSACASKSNEESTAPGQQPAQSPQAGESQAKAQEPDDTSEQSFARAMQIICDAPAAAEVQAADPAERSRKIAAQIAQQVTHKRAILVFQSLANAAPAQRQEIMHGFADEAQIPDCRILADYASASEGPAALAIDDAPGAASDAPAAASDAPVAANDPAGAGEEAEQSIPFEAHYLGKHMLGVNRVNDGKRAGKGTIVREANALVLQASVKEGAFYLDISGVVRPVSKTEFVLDGQFTGIPDLSWRDEAPSKHSTQGSFTFRATKGRKFWRLYEVDGVECVCNDNCGNEFCYIDLSF